MQHADCTLSLSHKRSQNVRPNFLTNTPVRAVSRRPTQNTDEDTFPNISSQMHYNDPRTVLMDTQHTSRQQTGGQLVVFIKIQLNTSLG
jgi:hypothetical protein